MSLSELQMKTNLSYVTIQQIVHELERDGIIETSVDTNSRGRVRKVILVSDLHKKISEMFIEILNSCYYLFNRGSKKRFDKISPSDVTLDNYISS